MFKYVKWLVLFMFLTGCSQEVVSKDHPQQKIEIADEQSDTKEVQQSVQIEEGKIHFIDTGNSDAILIQHGNEGVLIDGGDNNDEKRVVDYIRKQGVTSLSLVVATHFDADHIGGLDAVVSKLPVKQTWVSNGDADTITYRDFINALAQKGLKPAVPLIGAEVKIGSATLKVLAAANEKDPNNNSIVLRYQNGEDVALFLGDLKDTKDRTLQAGKVDLLKVSHHGAKNGTSQQLLNQIQPEYAVITTGKNKYGHPHQELLQRLKGIELHRTDECGDVVFVSTGIGMKPQGEPGSFTPGGEETTSVAPTPTTQEGVVYWTVSGTKYHKDPNCSNMKSPISGSISDSGREPCQKCY